MDKTIFEGVDTAGERDALFAELISSNFCRCEAKADTDAPEFDAQMKKVQLGQITVMHYQGGGLQKAHRTSSHLKQDETDEMWLYLPITASINMTHAGHQTVIAPGTFAFVSLTKPFTGILSGQDHADYQTLHARIPGPLVRERFGRIDDYYNQLVNLRPGAGRVMASLLQTVLSEADQLSAPQAKILGHAVVDAICSAAHDALNEHDYAQTQADRRLAAMRERVQDFIAANLSNPDLTTLLIAQRCGISVRYLHAAFEATDWTVASYVREMRLQKCRAALHDPTMTGRSVTEIAYAWGFSDASHFSRAYKQRFGCAPSQDRIIGAVEI